MSMVEPDKKIRKLAEKWLKGTITPEEEQEFADWYNSDQESPLYMPGSFVTDEDAHRQRILRYVNKVKNNKSRIKNRKWRVLYAAAACLALLIGNFLWRNIKSNTDTSTVELKTVFAENTQLIKRINTSDSTLFIVLSDSSTIQLGNNSQVVYSRDYGKKDRTLYLKGEAVFDVKHDASLPFEVHTSQLVAKVLGTKFKINTGTNGQKITVAVLEGKVSVSREMPLTTSLKTDNHIKESAGFVLIPNQRIVFDPSSMEMHKSLVPLPVAIDSAAHVEEKKLQFEATPLSQVFSEISKVYGISVIFDSTALKNCTLTADLNKGSFYDKLDKICLATNLHYNEMDGHIVITGEGCN